MNRTPEDVAREVAGALYVAMHQDRAWAQSAWDDMGGSEPTDERALLELVALNLIRDRDAEIRAETLAGFTEERCGPHHHICVECRRDYTVDSSRHAHCHRRLVGPWRQLHDLDDVARELGIDLSEEP